MQFFIEKSTYINPYKAKSKVSQFETLLTSALKKLHKNKIIFSEN
jgi:hypothetical protein